MPINFSGYNLSNAVGQGLALGTSASRITPGSYGVKVPTLPAMNGAAVGGGTYKVYPFPVDSLDLNSGAWSTSLYRFTAPAPGLYYTSYGGIIGDGSGLSRPAYYGIIVNGALKYFSYNDMVSTWMLHHLEMVLKLAQGDTVAWAMNTAPGPTNPSAGGAYQSNHNTCTIWFIG